MDKPWDKAQWPEHDQESPLIAITFNLVPLTQQIIDLYKTDKDNKTQRQLKSINLAENHSAGNRKNFEAFKEMNYKKYFYKQTREKNNRF